MFYVHDVTNKILSRESNYIVYIFMWPKFGTLALLWKKFYFFKVYFFTKLYFFKDLTRKTFFWEVALVQDQ